MRQTWAATMIRAREQIGWVVVQRRNIRRLRGTAHMQAFDGVGVAPHQGRGIQCHLAHRPPSTLPTAWTQMTLRSRNGMSIKPQDFQGAYQESSSVHPSPQPTRCRRATGGLRAPRSIRFFSQLCPAVALERRPWSVATPGTQLQLRPCRTAFSEACYC